MKNAMHLLHLLGKTSKSATDSFSGVTTIVFSFGDEWLLTYNLVNQAKVYYGAQNPSATVVCLSVCP